MLMLTHYYAHVNIMFMLLFYSMNVLFWNVCSEADEHEIHQNIAELIGTLAVDIAFLHEVPYNLAGIPVSEPLASELGMEHSFSHTRTIYHSQHRLRGYGSAVLTATPPAKQSFIPLRTDRYAYMTAHRDNKRVLSLIRPKENPNLTIGSAHLSYRLPFHVGRAGLNVERHRLAAELTEAQLSGEVLFGGDVNVSPNDSLDSLIDSVGLRGVSNRNTPTFISRHWFVGHAQRNLDRVYATRGLNVEVMQESPRQSDHAPLIARISV